MRPCTSRSTSRLIAAVSLASLLTAPAARAADGTTAIHQAAPPQHPTRAADVPQASNPSHSAVDIGQVGAAPDPCAKATGGIQSERCAQPEITPSGLSAPAKPAKLDLDKVLAQPDATQYIDGVPVITVIAPPRM